ncbi:MAG: inorganic pyrophosphatase [Clostridia bacterium]|nr:inorganic pyrophosphatase [Clostridia bacterium]
MGARVEVTVDRPLGSRHPDYPDTCYPVNYGYVKGIQAPDGEEQDAYILGVDTPLSQFKGEVIAVIHRRNDSEDKWVVAPIGTTFSRDDILSAVSFMERYFDSILYQ